MVDDAFAQVESSAESSANSSVESSQPPSLMAQRLRIAREAAGLSRTQAAARAEIADNSIYRYENGRNTPRSEILAKLARIYGRPVEWFRGDPAAVVGPIWHFSDAAMAGSIRDVEVTSVPVIATVAGAGSFDWDDSSRYWLPYRQDWLTPNGMNVLNCRLVEVRGDSMLPIFPSGSLVMVDLDRFSLWDGRLYLISVANEGVVLRRVSQDGTGWVVAADNPAVRPRIYDKSWTVYGQVRMSYTVFD